MPALLCLLAALLCLAVPGSLLLNMEKLELLAEPMPVPGNVTKINTE